MSSGKSAEGANADAELVADAAIARWEAIREALAPVLGQRGVAALHRRALHLASVAHPCLLDAAAAQDALTFASLRRVLRKLCAMRFEMC